jgi:hypothetical protein
MVNKGTPYFLHCVKQDFFQLLNMDDPSETYEVLWSQNLPSGPELPLLHVTHTRGSPTDVTFCFIAPKESEDIRQVDDKTLKCLVSYLGTGDMETLVKSSASRSSTDSIAIALNKLLCTSLAKAAVEFGKLEEQSWEVKSTP